MTVVVFDGKTLAADKQCTVNGFRHTVTKIYQVGDAIVGCAGSADQCAEMVEWVRAGCKADEFPKSQRDKDDWAETVVISGGKILMYIRTPHPVEIEDPVFAIGSGREVALTAMFLGCDARQAVAIACKLDSGCGMGCDAIDLEPEEAAG